MSSERREIHICVVDENGRLFNFIGSDDKEYARIWKVFRVPKYMMGRLVFSVNNVTVLLDETAPTFVNKIPKDAEELPQNEAEALHKYPSHYWGGYLERKSHEGS